MWQRFKQRFRDVRTVSALCRSAERHALAEGHASPGAEHFLLAALELPDGTARRAFARLGADPDQLRSAVNAQHRAALASVGVVLPVASALDAPVALPAPVHTWYRAAPSAQAVFKALAGGARVGRRPLVGADVVWSVAGARVSTAARALRAMGVDPEALQAAARAEIDESAAAH